MKKLNESFICLHCHKEVSPHPYGGCRNHCPFCLYSKHVDADVPGDRQEECGGAMIAVRAEADARKGAILTFHCQSCGKIGRNRVAPDDNWEKVCQLSRVPWHE